MKYWLGVVNLDHVLKGVQGGFAQVCHGKKGSLSKISKADWLIYYSPKRSLDGEDPLKQFTAIGKATDDIVFQFEMSQSFKPFRRKIKYMKNAKPVPLDDLKALLEFTQERNWGYRLRLGLLELSLHDFQLISEKMLGKRLPDIARYSDDK